MNLLQLVQCLSRPSRACFRLGGLRYGVTLMAGLLFFGATGCAFHYYDSTSGTDHVFGFGHLRMRVIDKAENAQAVVKGTTVVGLKLGAGLDNYSVGAGYDSGYRIIIQSNDVTLRFEWPSADGFNLRLGTAPPFAPAVFTNRNPASVNFPATPTNQAVNQPVQP